MHLENQLRPVCFMFITLWGCTDIASARKSFREVAEDGDSDTAVPQHIDINTPPKGPVVLNANTVFLADLEEDNESDRELSDSDFNPETRPDFINMYACFLPYFIISHITFSGQKINFIRSWRVTCCRQ